MKLTKERAMFVLGALAVLLFAASFFTTAYGRWTSLASYGIVIVLIVLALWPRRPGRGRRRAG